MTTLSASSFGSRYSNSPKKISTCFAVRVTIQSYNTRTDKDELIGTSFGLP